MNTFCLLLDDESNQYLQELAAASQRSRSSYLRSLIRYTYKQRVWSPLVTTEDKRLSVVKVAEMLTAVEKRSVSADDVQRLVDQRMLTLHHLDGIEFIYRSDVCSYIIAHDIEIYGLE